MSEQTGDLWAYLSTSPLLWLTATLGVFLVARWLARLSGHNALVNPILISVLVIAVILHVTGLSYADYMAGAQPINMMLGPATVALGVPLWRNRRKVRELLVPIVAALSVGAPFAMASAVWISAWLGASRAVQLALVPKSTTAGFAVGIAAQIGAEPSLTAVLVIFTGITGAVIVTPLMDTLGIKDYTARGFAVGLTAHGIGTVRAFQVSTVAGTFAGLAMTLNGIVTAFLAPILAGWLVS